MAKPQSVFLTAVVAMVLGIAIGVVGLLVVVGQLSPGARDVANELEIPAPGPQVYGSR
jgi:hypothetical protein